MTYTVIEVLGGDRFVVSPHWMWDDKEGNVVHPIGYSAPEEGEEGFQSAKDRLRMLILGKTVDISNQITVTFGQLLCEVRIHGENLASFFPEHQ